VGETVILVELAAQAPPAANAASAQTKIRTVFMLVISALLQQNFTGGRWRRGSSRISRRSRIRRSRHPPLRDMLKPDVLPSA
jgi:hypothetical protein